jgi:hypothetical protein
MLLLGATVPGLHGQEPGRTMSTDLSLRPGYHGAWRVDRDGTLSDRHDFRMRLQLGTWWTPDKDWAFRGRVAGRLSSEEGDFRFYLRDHVPTTDGLRQGEFTVDEAYLRWQRDDRVQIRAGRMQTGFELAGVARKSLDRNDSPNTEVSWTDGVHASVLLREGWRQHLIVQRNSELGPSNVVRGPLDVTGSDSPLTIFGALQFEERRGPFIQREIDVTYLPKVVPDADRGVSRGDYVSLVGRFAVEPSATLLTGRVVLGAEFGYAFGAPSRALVGTGPPAAGRSDGRAVQLSANLMKVHERHSLGIVYARAGDGWLISPDIRSNNRELEARYYWQYAPWGRLDVRIRQRDELRAPEDALRQRRDRDIYVRTSLRF